MPNLDALFRKLLIAAPLTPLSPFIPFLWIDFGSPAIKLTIIYGVGLLAVSFCATRLSKQHRGKDLSIVSNMSNLMGGGFTLVSLALPYSIIYGAFPQLIAWQLANAEIGVTVQLIIAGGVITLFSRYGTILTVAGLFRFTFTPFLYDRTLILGSPYFALGGGFWLAWAGTVISLAGRSWTLPFPRPRIRNKERNPADQVLV